MAITYYDDDDDDGPDSAEQSWPWLECQFAGTKGRREVLLRRIRMGALGKYATPAPLVVPTLAEAKRQERARAEVIAAMLAPKNYRLDNKPRSPAEIACAKAWPDRLEAVRAAEAAAVPTYRLDAEGKRVRRF